MLVFEERGSQVPREKPLGARERTNNKLIPHILLMLGCWATLVGGECSHHCITLPPFQSTIIKHLQEHLQTNWFALKCAHCNNDISDKQACAAGPRNLILVIKVCEAVLISLFWVATDSMNYQKCVLISFHLD